MLRSFKLALALIRIPHLALSLFLLPLIVSIGLVLAQLFVTVAVINVSTVDTETLTASTKFQEDNNLLRWLLFGSGKLRPPLIVCRWSGPTSTVPREHPTTPDCRPDRFDIALNVPDPDTYDPSPFVKLFNGQVDRLHICRGCNPDVVITTSASGATSSRAHSMFGLGILFLPYTNREIHDHRIATRRATESIAHHLGSISVSIPEVEKAIGVSALRGTLPLTANIAMLVIISLWLALRAHRKVLDYFSSNDVLLPMVAACGKQRFYSAIWVLTMLRVLCFLGASIPLVYFGLSDIFGGVGDVQPPVSASYFCLWLLTLIASLALATVLASISELKHRHTLLSFGYKFVPMLLAFMGAAAWGASFVFSYQSLGVLRLSLSSLPIIGLGPVVVAPVTNLPLFPMATHALLATAAVVILLRRNARWFAAHLEEV